MPFNRVVRKGLGCWRGFTLVELMTVVAIVAVLATSSMPVYQQFVTRAKMAEGIAGCGAIRTALRVYEAAHGRYPTLSAANGAELQVIGVRALDLEGKYFEATDYQVSSTDNTYTIEAVYVTAAGEEHTYILDQDGNELGTVKAL